MEKQARATRRFLLLILVLPSLAAVLLATQQGPLAAQPPLLVAQQGTVQGPPAPGATLRYRRVLVPKDRIAEVAAGHMPLKRERFEEYLAEIRAASSANQAASSRVTRADYYARFQDNQLVDGSARLSIALAKPRPTLVSLAPCGLALGLVVPMPEVTAEPETADQPPVESADPEPATPESETPESETPETETPESETPESETPETGATTADTSEADARQPENSAADEPESEMSDSAEPDRAASEGAEPSAERPATPPSTTAGRPAGMQPGGVTMPAVSGTRVGVAADEQLWAYVPRAGDLEFAWSLRGEPREAGGAEFDVRLARTPTSRLWIDVPADWKLVAETGIVSLLEKSGQNGEAGLEALADEWPELERIPAGHRRWLIELGGTSQVALQVLPAESVTATRQRVEVRQATTYLVKRSGVEVSAELRLAIPQPPIRQLRLRLSPAWQISGVRCRGRDVRWRETPEVDAAWRDVFLEFEEPVSGADCRIQVSGFAPLELARRQRLPMLQVVDGLWREGAARLEVSEALVPQRVETIGCQELSAADSSKPGHPRQRQFQCFLPNAAIIIRADTREPTLRLTSGLRLRPREEELTAEFRGRFTSDWGETFRLTAPFPAEWEILEVQVEPPELLDSYELEPVPGSQPPRRRLVVRLARALEQDRPIELRLRGRRETSAERPLQGDDFRLWTFEGLAARRHLIALDKLPQREPRLVNDLELVRLAPEGLSGEERTLIGGEGNPLVFLDDSAVDGLRIEQRRVQPEFSVDIGMRATVHDDRLEEEYRLSCRPETGQLRKLVVHFSQPRQGPVSWSLPEREGNSLRAKRLEPSRDEGDGGGEAWEIELPEPTSDPVTLVARRSTAGNGIYPLALAAVHAAAAQNGEIEVFGGDGRAVRVTARHATQLPNAALPEDQFTTGRALLRYEPSRTGGVQVALAPANEEDTGVWAWSYTVDSQVARHGASIHRATWKLENTGAEFVTLEWPDELSIHRWELDGRTLDPAAVQQRDNRVRCRLPRGVRFPTLSVEYTSRSEPLGSLSTLVLAAPRPNFPVMDRHWRLRLPSEYGRLPDRLWRDWLARGEVDWLARLLGPLAARDSTGKLLARQFWDDPRPRADVEGTLPRVFWASLERGREAFEQREGPPATWGDLIRRCGEDLETAGGRLVVDRAALQRAGLNPTELFFTDPEVESPASPRKLFRQRGLLLIASGRTLILTTRAEQSDYGQALPDDSDGLAAMVAPSETAGGLEQATRDTERFAEAAFWSSAPAPLTGPWRDGAGDDTPSDSQGWPPDSQGWSLHQLEMPADAVLRCRLYRFSLLRAAGWISLLMTVGLACWLCRSRPARLFPLVALAALAAIWVPPLLVPMASGAFLGTLIAGIGVLAWNQKETLGEHGPLDGSGTAASLLDARWPIWLLAVLLSTAATRGVPGQEPSAEGPNRDKIYRILIPVNEDRRPVGDHDYLPLAFYESVLRRAAAARAAPQGWLIEAARYEGTLNLDGPSRDGLNGNGLNGNGLNGNGLPLATPLDQFTATYQLATFEPDQRVRLDLARRYLDLVGAHLNGKPLEILWRDEGTYLEVPVSRPGSHELELTLRPLIRVFDQRQGFEIRLPRAGRAELDLKIFGDARRVDVPSARGAVRWEGDGNRLRAELGPADRLWVRWSAETPPESPMDVVADELLWLKIKPHSVVLDAQLRVVARSGNLDSVTLLADPRLRLLRIDPPLLARPLVRSGPQQSLTLKLADSPRRDVVLRASFILEDSSGIGNLGVPGLRVVADRTKRRWMAVSVAPPLQLRSTNVAAAARLEAAEFTAAWGADAEPPRVAFDAQQDLDRWTVATRFRESRTEVEQQSRWSVASQSVQVRYEATLRDAGPRSYEQQFTVPPDLRVRRVMVEDDGRWREAEHAANGDRKLVVFLGERPGETLRLVIEGQVELRGRDALPLPLITLDEAEVVSHRVAIYRRPSALVRVDGVTGLVPDEQPLSEAYQPGWGRLVTRLVAAGDAGSPNPPSGRLRIAANRPARDARLIISLRRDNGRWTAEVDYGIRVRQGLLDALRLEIPPEWSPRPELPADLRHVVRDIPGGQRRELVVYPPAAVHDEFHFRVRGELSDLTGSGGSLPDIVPVNVDQVERYVVLPTKEAQGEIEWKPSGLQPSVMPRERADLPSDQYTAYRLVSPRPRAAVRQVKRQAEVTRVRLADIRLDWHESGECQGVALFDLEPAAARTVRLRLPEPYRLVHVRVANRPAFVESRAATRYLVHLGPERLPQRIEVVFRGQLPPVETDREAWQVPLPRLEDLEVERTLWTVRTDPAAARWRPSAMNQPLTPLTLQKWRLHSAAELIAGSVDRLQDRAQREIDDWYVPWERRLRQAAVRTRQAAETGSGDASGEEFDAAVLASLEEQQERIAQRLQTTRLRAPWTSPPARGLDSVDAWRTADSRVMNATSGVSTGTVPSLTLVHLSRGLATVWMLLAGSAVVVLLVSLLGWLFARGWIQASVAQWPHGVGVLLGLAWWLCLWPPFIGWIIVAVSLVGVFRRPWKAVAQSSASTVIRRESAF